MQIRNYESYFRLWDIGVSLRYFYSMFTNNKNTISSMCTMYIGSFLQEPLKPDFWVSDRTENDLKNAVFC